MSETGKTTDELLETVGSQRSSHTAGSIADAERELKARTDGEAGLFRAKLQKIGTICAVLGGLGAFWGAAMAILGLTVFADFSSPGSDDFVFRNFSVIYVVGAMAEALAGAVFFAGGLDLRRLRERGRRLVIAVLWLLMAYTEVFTVWWVVSLTSPARGDARALFMAALGVAMSGGWAFLLWLPLRFFHSTRVRTACSRTAPVRTSPAGG